MEYLHIYSWKITYKYLKFLTYNIFCRLKKIIQRTVTFSVYFLEPITVLPIWHLRKVQMYLYIVSICVKLKTKTN